MPKRDPMGAQSVAWSMLGEIERTSRLAAAAMVGKRGYAAAQARSEALRADREQRWSSIVQAITWRRARQDEDAGKQIRIRLDDLLLPISEAKAEVSVGQDVFATPERPSIKVETHEG